ncbi:MAG: DUF2336 domain-containing protein [Bradyrhizobium sp.]
MTMFYSLISEVRDASTSGSTKRQLKALARLTEFFLAGSGRHSKQQVELFDEVFRVLVAVIETKTRTKLACHFASDPSAPAALIKAFAFDDEIAVAAPVLSQSMSLSECDLIANAQTKSQGHLYAIAQRRTLGEAVTEILIQRGEAIVLRAVAKNVGARISDSGFRELVVRSDHDTELALHVGVRPDIPRHHFLKLLETTSASVRNKIAAAHPQFAGAVREAVTEVIDEVNREIRDGSADHAKAKRKVERREYWKELGEADVHAAARAQDFERAVMALSVLARCSIEIVERAVLNENPGAVQVVARAAGCSWGTVKALLLMAAADRKMSRMDLDWARENFQRLEVATARRVLEFYARRHHPTSGGSTQERA